MMEAMFEEMKENGIPGKKCRVKQRTRSKRKRKGFIVFQYLSSITSQPTPRAK